MDICPREPTQEMLVAGRKQIFADMVGEHMGPNCERAWKAMFDARPTADLGEDGELIARLRAKRLDVSKGRPTIAELEAILTEPNLAAVSIHADGSVTVGDVFTNPDGPEAADRLILYREALTGLLASCSSKPVGGGDGGTHYVTGPSVEAMRKARDVLSRSEAQPRSASS